MLKSRGREERRSLWSYSTCSAGMSLSVKSSGNFTHHKIHLALIFPRIQAWDGNSTPERWLKSFHSNGKMLSNAMPANARYSRWSFLFASNYVLSQSALSFCFTSHSLLCRWCHGAFHNSSVTAIRIECGMDNQTIVKRKWWLMNFYDSPNYVGR